MAMLENDDQPTRAEVGTLLAEAKAGRLVSDTGLPERIDNLLLAIAFDGDPDGTIAAQVAAYAATLPPGEG